MQALLVSIFKIATERNIAVICSLPCRVLFGITPLQQAVIRSAFFLAKAELAVRRKSVESGHMYGVRKIVAVKRDIRSRGYLIRARAEISLLVNFLQY